jgi:hypothetical protein
MQSSLAGLESPLCNAIDVHHCLHRTPVISGWRSRRSAIWSSSELPTQLSRGQKQRGHHSKSASGKEPLKSALLSTTPQHRHPGPCFHFPHTHTPLTLAGVSLFPVHTLLPLAKPMASPKPAPQWVQELLVFYAGVFYRHLWPFETLPNVETCLTTFWKFPCSIYSKATTQMYSKTYTQQY